MAKLTENHTFGSFRIISESRTETSPLDWARAFKCAALREAEHHVMSGALIPDVLMEVVTTPEDALEREQEAYLEERVDAPKVHIVMIRSGKTTEVGNVYVNKEDARAVADRVRHNDSFDHAWVETREIFDGTAP